MTETDRVLSLAHERAKLACADPLVLKRVAPGPVQPFLFAPPDTTWIEVKDGNDTARALFDQHYSRYRYTDGRKPLLFVGPGAKMVLLTPCAQALFVWRRYVDGAQVNLVVEQWLKNNARDVANLGLSEILEKIARDLTGDSRGASRASPAMTLSVTRQTRSQSESVRHSATQLMLIESMRGGEPLSYDQEKARNAGSDTPKIRNHIESTAGDGPQSTATTSRDITLNGDRQISQNCSPTSEIGVHNQETKSRLSSGVSCCTDLATSALSVDPELISPLTTSSLLREADDTLLRTLKSYVAGVMQEKGRDCNPYGVCCAIFRNEGAGVASELILAAMEIAWERWPGERLYTYVDDRKVRRSRQPGRCFLKAGWRYVLDAHGKPARTKWNKLLILERLPEWSMSS